MMPHEALNALTPPAGVSVAAALKHECPAGRGYMVVMQGNTLKLQHRHRDFSENMSESVDYQQKTNNSLTR